MFVQKGSSTEQQMGWTSQAAAWVCSALPGPVWVQIWDLWCLTWVWCAWVCVSVPMLGLPPVPWLWLIQPHALDLLLYVLTEPGSGWNFEHPHLGFWAPSACSTAYAAPARRAALCWLWLLEQCDPVRQSISEHSCQQIPLSGEAGGSQPLWRRAGSHCATRLTWSPLEACAADRRWFTGTHSQGQVKLSQLQQLHLRIGQA